MYSAFSSFFTAVLLLAATSLSSTGALAADGDTGSDDVTKVVYHADFSDPRRFSAMLTSINNMVTYYQNQLVDYDVRIVFVAHGIRFLTDKKLENTPFKSDPRLDALRDNLRGRLSALNTIQDVKLELCDITRTQINLPKDMLYDGVTLVHSGVVQIADLQQQGFAYIKIE